MAAPEHLELSTYIKNVHLTLRQNSEKFGYIQAWQDHCKNRDCLQQYAHSMKELATKFWDQNALKQDSKVISRIKWVYNFCLEYFTPEFLLKHRTKEIEICKKLNQNFRDINLDINVSLKLLDVGSCYNPFKVYKCFNTIAIDIAPATADVFYCDFTNVKLASEFILKNNQIEQFELNSFHIIVFSLFLEYLPSPEQRLKCCIQAYNLLKPEGILFIITPDSKHAGANAKYMKNWQFTLARIGFARIKYEKLPYLHCMVFRKCINKEVAYRWAKLNEDKGFTDSLNIPQDFQDNRMDTSTSVRTENEDLSNYFHELPYDL